MQAATRATVLWTSATRGGVRPLLRHLDSTLAALVAIDIADKRRHLALRIVIVPELEVLRGLQFRRRPRADESLIATMLPVR
jgi:hypothetical protein